MYSPKENCQKILFILTKFKNKIQIHGIRSVKRYQFTVLKIFTVSLCMFPSSSLNYIIALDNLTIIYLFM